MSSQDVLRPGVMTHKGHHHNLRHRFELVRTLGQGTYGKVKLAVERSTGAKYAIKTIRKSQINSEQDLARIRREIDIMATLNHPNIITVYEVYENREKIILVLEHASGGELYDYINDRKGLTEDEARKFFRQIVSAVHYLHKSGFVHRDLKLENIMLDGRGCVKIGDFGLANVYSFDQLLRTFCGSPLYASPEIVNGLPYHGPEVDCWSLGVLLYTLVYGAMPFDGSDFKKLRKQISEADYFEPIRPADAAGLIRQLLTVSPTQRATTEDIIRHWWINLGYSISPVEDTTWGSPVDVKYYRRSQSFGESSQSGGESDCETERTESPSVENKKPLKGILKKSKESLCGSSDSKAVFSDSGWSENVGCSSPSEYFETVDVSCKSASPNHGESDILTSNSVESVQDVLGCVTLSESQDSIGSTQTPCGASNDVFEPSRKPKRGILKNKSKYTAGDSGCIMEDPMLLGYFSKDDCSGDLICHAQVESCYENEARTELGSNETLDSCETENSAIVEVEEEDDEYNMSDIEAILDDEDEEAIDEQDDADEVDERESVNDSDGDGEDEEEEYCGSCLPENVMSQTMSEAEICVVSADMQKDTDLGHTPSEVSSSGCSCAHSEQSLLGDLTPDGTQHDQGKPSHTSTPAYPMKGILKKNGRFSSSSSSNSGEAHIFHTQLSLGSQSSCSSGDILDFSYDSGNEGEAFMINHSCSSQWKQPFQSDDCDKQSNEELDKVDIDEKFELISQYGLPVGSFRTSEDEWLNQINLLGDAYYEENLHREAVTNDLFNIDEAREVHKKALDIVDKVT